MARNVSRMPDIPLEKKIVNIATDILDINKCNRSMFSENHWFFLLVENE